MIGQDHHALLRRVNEFCDQRQSLLCEAIRQRNGIVERFGQRRGFGDVPAASLHQGRRALSHAEQQVLTILTTLNQAVSRLVELGSSLALAASNYEALTQHATELMNLKERKLKREVRDQLPNLRLVRNHQEHCAGLEEGEHQQQTEWPGLNPDQNECPPLPEMLEHGSQGEPPAGPFEAYLPGGRLTPRSSSPLPNSPQLFA